MSLELRDESGSSVQDNSVWIAVEAIDVVNEALDWPDRTVGLGPDQTRLILVWSGPKVKDRTGLILVWSGPKVKDRTVKQSPFLVQTGLKLS